jgi:hypothetical protein
MFLWSLSVSWSVSLDRFSFSDRLYNDISVWILRPTGAVDCNFVWFNEYFFFIQKCITIRNFQAVTVVLSTYCFFATFSSSFSLIFFLNLSLSPPSFSLSLLPPLTLWPNSGCGSLTVFLLWYSIQFAGFWWSDQDCLKWNLWEKKSLCDIHSSIANKMQSYTMVFIIINAVHVSGGSSAHHEELKNVHTISGITQYPASYSYREWVVPWKSPTNTRYSVYSFEFLMMGEGTACNMWSTYNSKYHCVTLHLVGYAWIH